MNEAIKDAVLAVMNQKDYHPQTKDELAAKLAVSERADFDAVLKEMEQQGDIIINRKGKCGLPWQMGYRVGWLEVNGHGPGTLREPSPKPGARGVYIPGTRQNGAMQGDFVAVRITHGQKYVNGYAEGEVARLLRRASLPVLGVYSENDGGAGVVHPEDRRHFFYTIFIPRGDALTARDGDRVVVKITRYGSKNRVPEGQITEVLGHADDASQDIPLILRKYGLMPNFPDKVQENAAQVAKLEASDYGGRLDLRQWLTVTMDGADAQDFDDAVSLEILDNGHYGLGVHIADVAHYVRGGSPLDREAWLRGTSVYFPGCVVPMLPAALSNDVCSLKPDVDRLTLSCLMEIDEHGAVVNSRVVESVVRSHARLTYDEVNAVLDGEPCLRGESFGRLFRELDALRICLNRRRLRRGALTFDLPEARLDCDEQGEVLSLCRRVQGRAEGIIEEAMILANETVAATYYRQDVPFIYRVHEPPPDDKLLALRDFLGLMGYTLTGDLAHIRPLDFQRLLSAVETHPETVRLQQTILFSMSHASYDVENRGHFGIASDCYCHFTAPIRRYPDLAIHRVIKGLLHPEIASETANLYRRLAQAAVQSSVRERLAEDAEREAVSVKIARYLSAHIGEVFSGIIVNVCSFGFFVQLENTAEGLVHVSSLADDYYEYHETRCCLVGEGTRRKFGLGDEVVIRVVRVNIPEHLIDFELVEDNDETK